MSIEQIFSEYLTFAWGAFQFDMKAFSQWWMYALMLIPACVYAMFFILKWFFITLPLWMPVLVILGGIRNIFAPYHISKDKIMHDKESRT